MKLQAIEPGTFMAEIRHSYLEDLEKEMEVQFKILAWEIPWPGGAWRATGHRVTRESNTT